VTRLLGSFDVEWLQRGALLRGAASVMNLRGDTRRHYRWYPSPDNDDAAALAEDWAQVGRDLREAIYYVCESKRLP
jgi:hypothetical protein